MDIFFSSLLLIVVTELGDKTQLLSFALASRFQRHWSILGAIVVATIANHLIAAFAGDFIAKLLSPNLLAVLVGGSFIGFAIWALLPEEEEEERISDRFGPFLTTLLLFFLAEMGDKTQLSAAALGAKFQKPFLVVAGTTCGMMLVNGPSVWLGKKIHKLIPAKAIKFIAATIFLIFGLLTLATLLVR
ncbi:MAG: TMEM165/GDT1 family protein [Blastocatellia bacterium]|nr:TMEM165/GDT1 family protein [Blastocatellia bacterium]